MVRSRPVLLLTRPEPASRRFAARFRERFGADWPVVIAPLMQIDFLPVPPEIAQGTFTDLIFTSANAVESLVRSQGQPQTIGARAWCVGPQTASAAEAAGFAPRVGPGDAAGLEAMIVAEAQGGSFLHPHGAHVTRHLTGALVGAGLRAESYVAYRQTDRAPDPAAIALMGGQAPVVLPLFSPRSARRAAEAFPMARAPLSVVALSQAVAGAFDLPARERIVAEAPNLDALLAAMVQPLARFMG